MPLDFNAFNGPYAELCRNFIEYKRSIGYTYGKRQVYAVKYLCDYLSEYSPGATGLSQNIVEGYIYRKPHESASSQSKRIYIIRHFGLYIASLGYKAYLPPYDSVKKDKTFVPYIYTKEEIKRIIKAAEDPANRYTAPNSHLVQPLMIKILFGCGLRISEALALKVGDVNLEEGILHIRQAKYNNSRLVPMPPNLAGDCLDYYKKTGHHAGRGGFFFEIKPGTQYSKSSFYNRFRSFLKQAGIAHGGRGKGPRLHDARHSRLCAGSNGKTRHGYLLRLANPCRIHGAPHYRKHRKIR